MTIAHTLKYAGADPYEPEHDRVAYRIAEVLQQDSTYQRLAQLRWILKQTVFGNIDNVSTEDAEPLVDAVVAAERCVDAYVAEWLAGNIEWLHAEVATSQQCLAAIRAYNVDDAQVSDRVQEHILADAAQEGTDVE